MSNQQFVKSPPTPADSELWKIGIKWRRSQTKNVDYTELDNIMTKHSDIDIPSLINELNNQLAGKLKQSINYVNHRIVASYTPDGKAFVYGFTPDREEEAEKKASWNSGVVPEGAKQQQQQQRTLQQTDLKSQVANTAAPSTIQVKPVSVTKQHLEVPFDLRPIKWNDVEAIQDALNDGLYPLPVKHTGVENWGFIGEMSGERTFWYGRIKLIEVD
jgi:hypothetical protein